jgi:hypothetical protein
VATESDGDYEKFLFACSNFKEKIGINVLWFRTVDIIVRSIPHQSEMVRVCRTPRVRAMSFRNLC